MKGVKIYTDSEIQQARSDLERKKRLFWNEKMEQLCSDPKQARHDKTTLCGMVDVSWTLRKSGMLETEANKVLYQEQVVLRGGEATTKKKLGTQKKGNNSQEHGLNECCSPTSGNVRWSAHKITSKSQ